MCYLLKLGDQIAHSPGFFLLVMALSPLLPRDGDVSLGFVKADTLCLRNAHEFTFYSRIETITLRFCLELTYSPWQRIGLPDFLQHPPVGRFDH